MCYYNGIKVTRNELFKLLELEAMVKNYEALNRPVQNCFEYNDYPIVQPVNGGKGISIELAHWELIPPMVRTRDDLPAFRKKYTTTNAKGETILTSPFYRNAALNGRCLVLSSGFYEWRHYKPNWSKKEIAYPYYITIPDKSYFYMAGISQPWTDKSTGETIDTFTLLTSPANTVMSEVHNKKKRMPNILTEELAYEWTNGRLSEKRIAELATFQFPSEQMEAYTINKDFRAMEEPREAFIYPELPALGEGGNDVGSSMATTLFPN